MPAKMLTDEIIACARLVETGDPDRFHAAMAAPLAARAVLFPLYALNVEVSRAPWVTKEPMVAEMRLQWWRDALDTIASGQTPPRHDVLTPLAALLDDPACAALDDMILARRWDIYKDPFEDTAAFETHLDHTAGTLMWISARALGAGAPCEPTLRRIGRAMGLANWLRAIPALERAGRVPLVDGRSETIRTLAQSALENLSTKGVDRAARPALLAAWQTRAILAAAAANPAAVADGSLAIGPLASRASLLKLKLLGRF